MAAMDGLLVAVRAVHYGATVVLFGELLFALLVSGTSTVGQEPPPPMREDEAAYCRFRRVAAAAWAGMMISGVFWLALVTIQMSGGPFSAIRTSAIATVLGSTVLSE